VGKPSEVKSDKFAPERNVTHVSRGNGYIFEQSFKAMRNGSRIGFLGGIKGYRFDLLEDVYRLYKADKPQDPFLKSFGSYEDLKLYAEDANDHDLARSARLIEEYTDRIPGMIAKIASGAVEDLGKADVGFTTAHKAKGAEFERVVMADDYYTLPYNNGARKNTMKQVLEDMEAEGRTKEELNISYVAMTRAIKNLYLPESFDKLREIPNIQSHIEAVKNTQITTKPTPGSRQSGPRMSAL
jgi:F-box protein 18 (helicase)